MRNSKANLSVLSGVCRSPSETMQTRSIRLRFEGCKSIEITWKLRGDELIVLIKAFELHPRVSHVQRRAL